MARAAPQFIERRRAQAIVGAMAFPTKTGDEFGVAAPRQPEVDDISPALSEFDKRRIAVARFIGQILIVRVAEPAARITPSIAAAHQPIGVGRPSEAEPMLHQPPILVAVAQESVRAPIAVDVPLFAVIRLFIAESRPKRKHRVLQTGERHPCVSFDRSAIQTGRKLRGRSTERQAGDSALLPRGLALQTATENEMLRRLH